MSHPRFHWLKMTIYRLKRAGGIAAIFYNSSNESVDYTTGAQKQSVISLRIERVVVLPEKARSEQSGAVSKDYSYGALYGSGSRRIIVDRRDLNSFSITLDTWLVIEGKKYVVKEIHDYEHLAFVGLIISRLEGSTASQKLDASSSDGIALTDSVANS